MCGMDYHDQFRLAAIAQGLPEDETVRFAELIRFGIFAGGREDGVRVGRLGGLPRLPVGMAWPGQPTGFPLPFMASLDCAALPRIAGLDLPEAGSLLFFLDPEAAFEACSIADEQEFAQVVYVPAGVETVAAEQPSAAEQFLGPEVDLFATVHPDLPPDLPERIQDLTMIHLRSDLVRDMPHLEEFHALLRSLWPAGRPWISAGVLIGGYTVSAQDSPEGQLIDEDRRREVGALPPGEDRLRRGMEEEYRVIRRWVPLAQFAVPHEEFMNGRFLIRFDDLSARRFDRALSFCEFTE
jgi:hypothetical protein